MPNRSWNTLTCSSLLFRDRAATTKHILDIIFANSKVDVLRFVILALFVGLLSFIPCIVIGSLISFLLPAQLYGMIGTALVGLTVVAIVIFLLHLSQHTTLLRLEGRGVTRITAAIWDRLLRLRQRDVRNFKAGDLLVRAMVFHNLRSELSGLVANSFISALFLFPALCLLYIYSVKLANATLAMGLISGRGHQHHGCFTVPLALTPTGSTPHVERQHGAVHQRNL